MGLYINGLTWILVPGNPNLPFRRCDVHTVLGGEESTEAFGKDCVLNRGLKGSVICNIDLYSYIHNIYHINEC